MTTDDAEEGELILYRTVDDAVRVEVMYESETFWLDQRCMDDPAEGATLGKIGWIRAERSGRAMLASMRMGADPDARLTAVRCGC